MRRTLRNGTVVEVLATGSRIILPDGTIVFGEPHYSESYQETARRLGYGEDVLRLCQEHDPAHAWLADAIGLKESPALRAAIGGAVDPAIASADEEATMSLQRFCRAAGVTLFLEAD